MTWTAVINMADYLIKGDAYICDIYLGYIPIFRQPNIPTPNIPTL